MRRLLPLLIALLATLSLDAQPQMSVSIENMHLWRGGEVADGFVLTTDLAYSDSQERFKVGFWGGTNSVGEYKEFNYYANYNFAGFCLALSDTYNFSSYATYNNEQFFNYDPSTTGRFLDATLRYDFGEKLPLVLSWSTVVFGRDRDVDNSFNRYSTFCYAGYKLYDNKGWQIDAGIGGAFALRADSTRANFFGSRSGVVELTLKASHSLTLGDYNLPLYMLMMWNPQSDEAYMQLCAEIFRF